MRKQKGNEEYSYLRMIEKENRDMFLRKRKILQNVSEKKDFMTLQYFFLCPDFGYTWIRFSDVLLYLNRWYVKIEIMKYLIGRELYPKTSEE